MGFWLAKTQQPFFHDFKRVFHDFTHGGAASHPSDKDPGMASPVDEGFRSLVFYLPVCANGGKFSAKGDRKSARSPALATTLRMVFK